MKNSNLFKYYIMLVVLAVFISAKAFASMIVIHPSSTQNQTQAISIPLTMNNESNMDIRSIDLDISYDPAVLTATGISLTGTVLENENYLYEFNTDFPGTIYAVFAANANHFTGTGLCLYLDFNVIGASGDTSDITISTAIVNNQAVSTSDGLFTVAPNAPPMFTGIIPQTINEDTFLFTILTINDYESNPCDLALTITSSDETLIPANTISYTCMSGSYYFSITPAANLNGVATITIIAEDSGVLTASAAFDLTVVSVNDAPVISANTSLTMNEDISSAFSLTVTDIETAGCSLGMTWQSSDAGILSDNDISYTCVGGSFLFNITPVENQSGNVTLSFTITDSGSFTETHALDINIVEINDTPQIGTITDQLQYGSAIIEALPLTASDIETATCSLEMTMISSNPILIPISNIAYTCASNSFYLTLTPVTDQSGASTITIIVTDSGGLTASTSFTLNINLPPELSFMPNTGTAVGEISFTFVEADGDTVSLTVTSSNQSLISDAAISINGTNSNTIELTSTAEMEQSISINLPQESNVHGLATITITASAIGGTVSETFNVIVSPPGSGNALNFDGDDDFIAFGSIDGSHPLALAGSQFSMAFWIKPAIIGDSFQRIIDKSTAGLAADGYLLCLNTGNSLKFYLNGMARFTTDSNVLTANMWHHVVVTGDASQYNCYVNGIAVGLSTENSFELPPNATANLYIGTWYTEETREYRGQMDEVSIWNVALSETDVRNIMCRRLSGNETGLLAYFRFDHFTGSILTDLSGNNFHGTLTHMDNASWNISEAPLGDTSINDYVGSVAADFEVTLSHSDGDAFTAFGDGGSYSGLHIYLVNEAPSTDTSPAGFSTLYTDHYFGVYPVGITPSYSVAYQYSGNTSIVTDTGLRLAGRANNSSAWFDLSASLNQGTTTLSKTGISTFTGISTTEFISGINNVPTIGVIAPQTMNEDAIIRSLPITATDAETATCSLNITFNSSDTVLVPVENISYTCSTDTFYLSITPLNNLTGMCDISITVTDEGGLSVSGTLALTVADVNDVPLISTISDQTTIEDLAVGSISLTVSDLEDAPCSMVINITSSDPILIPNENITYTCTSNTYFLTITPAADQNGLATITVTVIDSGTLTASYSFDYTITAVNDAPVLANPISNRIATEGNAYAYTVPSNTFVDVDTGDVLTYSATQENGSALPAWLSFDPSKRVFSGLPSNSDVGPITITITATDGSAQSITDTFVLNVNNTNTAPVLNYPIADQTIDEDVPYSYTFAADTFHDDDVAFGDTLSYTAMLDDGSPLPGWLIFDANNRHFSGTPTNDDAIVYTITVIAEDTLNLTAEDSFVLTVININDAPVISVLSQYIALNIDEDTIIHSIPLTVNDLETATCSLDITFVSSNTNLFPMEHISYTCNAETFYLSFTPTSDQSGIAVIAITVTDGSLSDSTAFAFTVNSVNDTPVLTGYSTVILDEDTSSSLSLTATDVETAGCSLNLTYVSSNTTLLPPENIAYTCNNGNINVNFTPVADQSGNTSLTFTVSDSGALSASHVVVITVNDLNDSPQIDVINDQTINENTILSAMKITVTDIETAGCSMDISVTSSNTWLIPVANISYTCSANIFYLTLTPVAEKSGSSTITVTITDDGYLSAIESFVFNVTEVYDMPGTIGNPYTITCIEELYNMRDDNVGAYYQLIRDLDFNDAASYNNPNDTSFGDINGNSSVEGILTELTTGTGWIGDFFGGHLDGRFNIIKNLYINTTNYAGLFQSTNHGTVIQNLGIVDADITKVGGYGGVVASEIHSTTIENVFVTGILRSTGADPNGRNNGGIAGYAVDGTSYITDCYSDVLIESNANEDAGIVGFNGATLTISNCLAKGNIPTGNGVGGMVGTHVGTLTIENSIAFMSQLTSGVVRRILANPAGGSYVLNNNYANSAMILNASTVTSTDTSSLEGKDMSLAQLTDSSFYSTYLSAWDFDSVWFMTGSGPKLKGFFSNALYFTGADDATSGTYVNLGAATHYNGLSELTCESWVKPMSTKTWQEILHVQDNSGSVNAITFNLYNGHSLYGYINQTTFGCPHVVRIGQWNHVAFTWRSSDGQIILYVNGENVSSGTSSTSPVASGAGGNVYIGTLSGTTEFFDGSIDELRIWNSVRTQSEIQSNMFQECMGNETNLLACYQFNQGSGTDLPDHGPNAMHGTLMNMTDNNWIASAAMSPIITGTSQITENSFYLSWQGPSDNDFQYYIEIDDNNDFSSPLVKYLSIGNGTDYTISNLGLDRATPYYCRILKLDEFGRSLYTEAQPFMVQTGKALNFQSTQSEYVNIGNDDSLHLSSQITLEGWFKFTAVTNDQGLVMKQYTVNDYHGFGLQYYVSGNPYFCFGLGDADSQENIYSITTPVTNQWYHVAATYDGVTIKMYVNGELESTRSYTGGFDGSSNNYDLVLGKFSLADAYYFNGQMDEIRIWDNALDQAAIQANMYRELSGRESHLVAYFPFNNNTANDMTSNHNDGTPFNMDETNFVISDNIINSSPVISDIVDQTIDEDTLSHAISFTVTDMESNASELILTVTISNSTLVQPGNMVLGGTDENRTLTISPTANENGTASITIMATDPNGLTASNAFVLTVTAINDQPSITSIIDQTIDEDAIITGISLTVTDIEDAPCSLDITVTSSDITLIPNENMAYTCSAGVYYFSITPIANLSGTATITITVLDSEGLTNMTSFDITISSVNEVPVISSISGQTISEDTSISNITFTATDIESPSCGLSITLLSSDQSLVPDTSLAYECNANDYTISAVPEANQNGLAVITVIVADSNGLTASTTFDLTVTSVNDTPEISLIEDQSIAEDTAINSISFTVADIEDAPCSMDITLISSDESIVPGTNLSYACNNNSYTITAIPVADQNGQVLITVTITDSNSLTAATSFVLTVTDILDAPIMSSIDDQNIMVNTTDFPVNLTVTDADGDNFTLTAFSSNIELISLENMSFSGITAQRTLLITPTADMIGNLTITVLATDSQGMTSSQAFAVTVVTVQQSGNYYPVITHIKDQTIDEDTSLDIHFISSDLEDSPCSMTVSLMSSNQSLIPDGNLSYTCVADQYTLTIMPVSDENGMAMISIIIADSGGLTASTSFAISVTPVNDAPTISNISNTSTGKNTATASLSFTVSDIEDDPCNLIFTGTSSNTDLIPNANISYGCNAGNYTISVMPVEAMSGLSTITVTIQDANGLTAITTFDVTVVNQAPIAGSGNDEESKTTDEDVSFTIIAGYDPDGDTLTINTIASPTNGVLGIDQANLIITYTPAINYHGTDQFKYEITDGTDSDSYTVTVIINDINDAPSLSIVSDQTIDEDTAINTIAITPTDSDASPCELILTFSSSNPSLITSGNISYVCDANAYTISAAPIADQNGVATITVTATDIYGATASTTFDLNVSAVNDAPVLANPISDRIAIKGTSYEYEMPSNTFADVDSGDSLTYTAAQSNGNPLPAWLSFDPATRIFSGLPSDTDVGAITIMITATDSLGESITETFVLSVNNTNSAPVLDNPIADQTISEDVPYAFTFAESTFRDDDAAFGDTLSYTAMLTDGSALPSWLTFDTGSRQFSGTPTNAEVGNYTIKVIAEDTLNLTAMDSFILTVENVNDAPQVNTAASNATIDEDTILSLALSLSDIDGDSLTLSALSSNTTLLSVNNITFSGTGESRTMTITPTANESGTVIISLAVFDGNLTSTTSFALTVTEINDPPLIGAIMDQTTLEDVAIDSIIFTVTDYEDTTPCCMDFTFTSSDISIIPVENISYDCILNSYTLTIIPAADQNGMVTISLTVTDSALFTSVRSFDLTITSENDIPILVNPVSDSTAAEGTSFAYTIPDNTFADVDYGDYLTYTATQSNGSPLPEWLSFEPATQVFSGLPSSSDIGTITITITATDASGESITDTFELSVNNSNSAPILENPIADQTIDEDVPYNFAFASDTFRDDDIVSGDTLSYIASLDDGSALPSWLTFDSDNRLFSGTPSNADVGTYIINVTAQDSLNMTAMDSFYLTVENVNDAPEISLLQDLTIDEDTSTNLISFTVADIDGDNLSVSASSNNLAIVPNENITLSGSGLSRSVTITPSPNANGIVTITIAVSDGIITSTSSFDLTVSPINDIPVLSSINSQSMFENTTITVTMTATDIENSGLIVTAVSSNQTLIPDSNVSVSNDGSLYTFTITPSNAQTGNTNITISVSDGTDTNRTTFSITVNESHYTIAGHVFYHTDTANSSIEGVLMTLSGTYSYSMLTDANGDYAFTNVRPGNYTLTASKSDDIHLDISDAVSILRASARKISLSCFEQIAADAYIDGYYGAYDASMVARYVSGLETCLNDNCTFWQFASENITNCESWPLIEFESERRYINLSGDAYDQNFIGIGCGNVSE